MLFIFWQLLSYLLYLLAHNLTHPATLEGAFKTFTFLRIGDAAFLAGIVLAHSLYGTIEFHELFARAAETSLTVSPFPGVEIGGPTAVTLLLFIGVMSKSAQFPLHVWLPSSLYAPTSVHALLHAGIINAGGFLMNRLAPLYGLSPITLHVALVVGTLTAILGASMMLTQNDIKKTLGFSTIGQMGYMIMECGLGAFGLAVFHLIAHGIFKATVFLNCGNVIHKARQEPAFPPAVQASEEAEISRLPWSIGFVTTLLMPLMILLVAHGVLQIPISKFAGLGHLSFLHLGDLYAGDIDPHAFACRGVLEGVGGHADGIARHRLYLSVCRRTVHRLSVSRPRRGGLLLPGCCTAGLPLRWISSHDDVADLFGLGLSQCSNEGT